MSDAFEISTTAINTECGITILETTGHDQKTGLPHLGTKTFTATTEGWSKQSYTAGYKFRVTEHAVADLADLRDLIEKLTTSGRYLAIRGAPNDEGRRLLAARPGQPIRRLWNMQKDGTPPTIRDVARRWFVLDLDNFPMPAGDDLANDPGRLIDAAIRTLLPEAFRRADYIWQLSASAGFSALLKVHVWFWSTEPFGSEPLKAIVEHFAPAFDPRLCHAVQNHYFAAPRIVGGVDPITKRIGWHQGEQRAVDLPALASLIPPPSAIDTGRRTDARGISYPTGTGGPGAPLEAMGDGASGFHAPLLAESVRYARCCQDTGARNDANWIAMIQAAIRAAPHAPDRDTSNYQATDYLQPLIESAFDRVITDERETAEADATDEDNSARALVLPAGFTRGDKGLYYQGEAANGETNAKPRRVSGPFDVVGHVDDGTGRQTGLLLAWRDHLLRKHSAIVSRDMLHGKPSELAAPLEAQGLRCVPGNVGLLRNFLHAIVPPHNLMAVSRPGWADASYVLRDGTVLGDPRVVMRPDMAAVDASAGQAGTLAEWKQQIAQYAAGNPTLAVAICIQFAAPLLAITGDEGGGLHLYGQSRGGKTTALYVCASVVGKGAKGAAVLSWRSTDNGLEGIAAGANDGVLPMDEIAEVSGQTVGAIIYMLANGSGKVRMTQRTTMREVKKWNCFILSNGEMTITAKMGEAGKKETAGMAVRMTDVPFMKTTHHHRFASGEAMAKHLAKASRTFYGTAARAYIARLAEARQRDEDGLLDHIRALRDTWMSAYCPAKADPQVRSIAARFALIGAAGELAREWNVLPWEPAEALGAAGALFEATIAARGHVGSAEGQAAIDSVATFLAKHGSSRFAELTDNGGSIEHGIRDRSGFRQFSGREGCFIYYVFPHMWAELCGTLDPLEVAREVRKRGFLIPTDATHLQLKKTFTGYKRQGYYAVRGSITGVGDEPDDAAAVTDQDDAA